MKTINRFRQYGSWYEQSRQMIREQFGDNADLFSRLLAATSPRKQVRANFILAERILTDVLEDRPIDYTGTLPCHRPNIQNAIHGVELSGPKVSAFAKNLMGDYKTVTVDVWILRYFKEKTATKKVYANISKRIKRIAKRYNIKPAECQAILWSIIRHRHGLAPRGFYQGSKQMEFNYGA